MTHFELTVQKFSLQIQVLRHQKSFKNFGDRNIHFDMKPGASRARPGPVKPMFMGPSALVGSALYRLNRTA